MNTPVIRSAAANADRKRKVSSVDRIMMYGIELWPSNVDNQWLSKMSGALTAAAQSGLDPALIKTAASMGIARLVRKVDEFQTRMFETIQKLMSWHEVPISEVIREMQYRIAKVGSAFDLTEEQVSRAVILGLARYIDDGGSPEFAIRLADLMGIAEEKRCFLRLAVDDATDG
jgi:hypothetical protein